MCNTAAESNKPSIFAFLWDGFLSKEGSVARIPWPSLRAAVLLGSITVVQEFHRRDPDCFNVPEPAASHGTKEGASQIKIAMRHDHIEYADYMLAHGADINLGYPEHSPVREAVRSTAEDETSFRHIRFLVEHGARVAGSAALEAAAGEGRADVLSYLIPYSDENDVRNALVAAEKSQREDIVELLRLHQSGNA